MTPRRQRLRCNVARVDDIFEGCLEEAERLLTPAGVDAWIDGASIVCNLGRGQELVLIFLESMPAVMHVAGEAVIDDVLDVVRFLSQTSNARGIAPFLSRLPACARRLDTHELMGAYFDLVRRIAQEAPAGLAPFLESGESLLRQISIGGVRNWVAYGLRTYRSQLHKAPDYFSLQSPDAKAALQRERKGTLLIDHQRKLDLYLRSFWEAEEEFHPFSMAYDIDRQPMPWLDRQGFHLPDVYEDTHRDGRTISGLDRYRAALAHLAAHRAWSHPFIADNFNRFQHLIIEAFEDARVEYLAMHRYPGLRRLWLALHPVPQEGDCPPGHSCIRHKAAILSRALLDPDHPYRDPKLLDAVARFRERVARDPHDTRIATDLGVDYLVKIHEVDFRSPRLFFKDTVVDYRDDNRFLWIFLEDTDEDDFHSDHHAANPIEAEARGGGGYARHQPEWDYETATYRPDWATVYESVQVEGNPGDIDRILERHAPLAKKLKRVVDLLKPQQHVRVRYQEDGAELDLDVALRAMLDHRAGTTPDPRIHMSLKPDARDISVMVLLDLSQSVNATPAGGESTVLELSREAVSLLGWTLDALGDPYAIAGFASNTRHDVRHFHFKGFTEAWGDEVKGRLAGMEGAFSTRMGTALRHAGHYLAKRRTEKKLLLLLTDGEPADIDVEDGEYLHADAHKAVEELGTAGITTFCFSLDPQADGYVSRIFGQRYTVLDRIERLPERLPAIYLQLTS